jgi:nicotinamidase-related amidase
VQALAVIDMQRWMFRLPERAAQLAPLVPTINRLAAGFAAAGLPLFDVRTAHKPDRSTWMIEGTPDVEPVDGLNIPIAARPVIKTANSAFLATDFEQQLRDLKVEKLVLAGVFIDGCVGLSAADAAQRGFEVILTQDAIGHCDGGHRPVIIEWLVSMYELAVKTADETLEAAR